MAAVSHCGVPGPSSPAKYLWLSCVFALWGLDALLWSLRPHSLRRSLHTITKERKRVCVVLYCCRISIPSVPAVLGHTASKYEEVDQAKNGGLQSNVY